MDSLGVRSALVATLVLSELCGSSAALVVLDTVSLHQFRRRRRFGFGRGVGGGFALAGLLFLFVLFGLITLYVLRSRRLQRAKTATQNQQPVQGAVIQPLPPPPPPATYPTVEVGVGAQSLAQAPVHPEGVPVPESDVTAPSAQHSLQQSGIMPQASQSVSAQVPVTGSQPVLAPTPPPGYT